MTEHITIEDRLAAIEQNQKMILALLGGDKQVLTLKQLAERYGMSTTSIRYSYQWYMPQFGKSDFEGRLKWTLTSIQEWEQIPVEERKQAFLKMKREEAQKVLASRK